MKANNDPRILCTVAQSATNLYPVLIEIAMDTNEAADSFVASFVETESAAEGESEAESESEAETDVHHETVMEQLLHSRNNLARRPASGNHRQEHHMAVASIIKEELHKAVQAGDSAVRLKALQAAVAHSQKRASSQ